jgi:hypothetical protein
LLTLGPDGLDTIEQLRPGLRALVMAPGEIAGEFRVIKRRL